MKYFLTAFFLSMTVFAFSQQAVSTDASAKRTVLFVYEEDNEKLGPWLERFRNEFRSSGVLFDELPAKEVATADVAKYDTIVIYGTVMAFASMEPVRDWLAKETRLSGKKVGLIVTANSWSLKKYYGQLTELLKKKQIVPVDAVSAATKNLTETEKNALVKNSIGAIVR